jgi:hypothetical protein
MLTAIHFHGQSVLHTAEVEDVRANGMLSAKLNPAQLAIT